MNPETKMPWDNPSQTGPVGAMPSGDYSATVLDSYKKPEELIDKKYGASKPYRVYIVGDIKSDPNK